MYRWFWLVGLLLSYATTAFAGDVASAADEHIATLIKQLDAEGFKEREAASKALVAIGEPVRTLLEASAQDKTASPELRLRAGEILKQLDIDKVRRNALSLKAIIEEARVAKRDKWDSARLEALLDRLVEVWSDAAGSPQKLPVNLKDLAAAGDAEVGRSARGSLIKMDVVRVSSIRDSIVLAETAVEASSAQNSIIIAGVGVRVSGLRNCIVIAGYDVDAGGEDNLILCGGKASGSILAKSVIGAPEGVSVSLAKHVTMLNSPATDRGAIGGERDAERVPRLVQSSAIVLDMAKQMSELEGVIEITLTLPHREPLVLYNRKEGDGEYVARAGAELRFPDGKPIPELVGWRLVYCSISGYAVFKNEDRQSVLFSPRGRR